MSLDNWKSRLEDAVEKSGKSARAISLAAKLGPGYVHSILKEGKDPTIANLVAICEAAGTTLTHVITGNQMDKQTEEMLRLLSKASDSQKAGLLEILKGLEAPSDN